MKHILLAELDSNETTKIAILREYLYDDLKGVWANNHGDLLVDDSRFAAVGTKKFDIETGEDYKGK